MFDKKYPISQFDLLCLNMNLLTLPDHDHVMIRSKNNPPMTMIHIQYRLLLVLISVIYFEKDPLYSFKAG